jgi:CO/xanthine dehydrogenase FAD-binding subunit
MQYLTPETTSEAANLLAQHPDHARILAGGTDLLVQMKADMIAPEVLIDIKRIPGLDRITKEDGGWRIGATVPCAEMGEHAGLKADWPGVVEAAELIGSTQVQGRCTIAGNLCNASPAADSVPALVAAGAVARICGPQGERDCPVADIPIGPGKTSLAAGEFITSILLPAQDKGSADAYLRFIPRTEMDIAVCSAGVNLTLNDSGTCTAARVTLGAVAPTVLLVKAAADALIGNKLDDAALKALASACEAACKPINDKRGTVEFRTDVAGVLARRAAKIAQARAGGTA